ncbi:hypothetical protein NECID01_1287 [Nematocida sp. AWRm77]|nr:hypothetical protein NECID01_1287 [Nematocida sp. AWRm77]
MRDADLYTHFRVKELKDNQGEPAEYEEYFKRVLEKASTHEHNKSALCAQLMQIVGDSSRSSTIVECSIKLLHLLGDRVLLPDEVEGVIEKEGVLSVYALHILERKSQISSWAGTVWTSLVSRALSSERALPYAFIVLLCYLCKHAEVQSMVAEFLASEKNRCTSLRIASELLTTEHAHMAVSMCSAYVSLIGNKDGFISREASCFYQRVKEVFPEYSYSFDNRQIDSLGHFLRDGYVHFSGVCREEIKNALQRDVLVSAESLFPSICFECLDVPKKIARSILFDKGSLTKDFISPIQLQNSYSSTKSLLHLFKETHDHIGCFEV